MATRLQCGTMPASCVTSTGIQSGNNAEIVIENRSLVGKVPLGSVCVQCPICLIDWWTCNLIKTSKYDIFIELKHPLTIS